MRGKYRTENPAPPASTPGPRKSRRSFLPRDDAGFTLVELLVTFALMMLALTMIYAFLLASSRFYMNTSVRSDKQSQMRMVISGLKEEFKTAEDKTTDDYKLLLLTDTQIGAAVSSMDTAGQRVYYFDQASGKLMLHAQGDPAPRLAWVDFDLPGLDVEFTVDADNDRIVRVRMRSEEVDLESDLALLNGPAWAYPGGLTPDPATIYRGVRLIPSR